MKKEEFKKFIRENRQLITYVKNNQMTWQGFYELYDLYGEDNKVWEEYLKDDVKKEATTDSITNTLSINQVVNWLKNIDLDGLQEGIGNVQRVLGVVQDFTKKDVTEEKAYKPRPLYKHFED